MVGELKPAGRRSNVCLSFIARPPLRCSLKRDLREDNGKSDDVMEAGISVRMVLLRADYEKRV